jgi:serine/threonine protein kinase
MSRGSQAPPEGFRPMSGRRKNSRASTRPSQKALSQPAAGKLADHPADDPLAPSPAKPAGRALTEREAPPGTEICHPTEPEAPGVSDIETAKTPGLCHPTEPEAPALGEAQTREAPGIETAPNPYTADSAATVTAAPSANPLAERRPTAEIPEPPPLPFRSGQPEPSTEEMLRSVAPRFSGDRNASTEDLRRHALASERPSEPKFDGFPLEASTEELRASSAAPRFAGRSPAASTTVTAGPEMAPLAERQKHDTAPESLPTLEIQEGHWETPGSSKPKAVSDAPTVAERWRQETLPVSLSAFPQSAEPTPSSSATLTAAPDLPAPSGERRAAETIADSQPLIHLESADGPVSPSATVTAASERPSSGLSPQRWSEALRALPARQSVGAASGETLGASESPDSVAEMALAGSDFILREKLGAGGQGEIWRAWQTSLGREVAVKRLRGGNAGVGEFLMEALTTAELDHPNIVPVHDLGRVRSGSGEAPLIAMKLARGTPWNDLLRRERESPDLDPNAFLGRHLRILADVCDAVAYAHAKRIIHRDLKPHQVIVGEFGEVFLIDWGLAVGLDDEIAPPIPAPGGAPRRHTLKTATNQTGTPAYMAPEQTGDTAASLGIHTDVYLLGAILFELLAGSPPHPGDNAREAYWAARDNVIRELPEGAPAELAATARKAISQKPEERHASASEFRADLESFLSGSGRRRESEAIVEEVAAELQDRASLDEATYSDLTRLRVRLARALQLWPESPRGLRLREVLLAAHARRAAMEGDLRLAESLAEELDPENSDRRQLLAQTRLARRQAQRERKQRVMALAACVLLLTLLAMGGAAFAFWQKRVSERLASANDELTRQRAEAVEARGRAEDLMDFMLHDLRDGLEPIGRLDLLKQVAAKALDYHATMSLDRSNPVELGRRGSALNNLGQVFRAQGEYEKAVEANREALALAQERLESMKRSLPALETAASAHIELGLSLNHFGDRAEEALDSYRAARKLILEGLQRAPDNEKPLWRQSLVVCALNMGSALVSGLGDLEEGLREMTSAVEMGSALLRDHPQMAEGLRRRLLIARNNLGRLLDQAGRGAEALAVYDALIEEARALWRDEPKNVHWLDALGDGLNLRGAALMRSGDAEATILARREAASVFGRLSEFEPENLGWGLKLGAARYNLAGALLTLGRVEEGLAELDAAIGVLTAPERFRPERMDYQHAGLLFGALDTAMEIRLALGQIEEARTVTDKAVSLTEQVAAGEGAAAANARASLGGYAYNAACFNALTGRTEEAFARLEIAVQAGYDDPDHGRVDPDLESLRQANPERFAGLMSRAQENASAGEAAAQESDADAALEKASSAE